MRYKTLYVEEDETRSIFDTKRRQRMKKNEGINKIKNDNVMVLADNYEINEEIHRTYSQIWRTTENINEDEQTNYIENLFQLIAEKEEHNPMSEKKQLDRIIKKPGEEHLTR